MPNPSNTTRRAKAQNIDETRESILARPFTTKQDTEARSLFSPPNFQERSAQPTRWNNLVPSGKFALRSRLTEQMSKLEGVA
jgi:hypothetical protein